ncbi:DUF452 family protein, partial [bacterium]|nr:DUF452 family protein [bacterium]
EIDRTTQELKEELISIQKLKIDFGIKYDRAIIPKEDIIVPYKNQLRYWGQTSAEIVEIPSAHYVFNCYSNWQDIIC